MQLGSWREGGREGQLTCIVTTENCQKLFLSVVDMVHPIFRSGDSHVLVAE